MHPEDLFDVGSYVDSATGDIWEKKRNGKWYVNGLLHKPFPHSLVPEREHIVESHDVYRPLGTPKDRELRDLEGYCE